MCFLTFFLLAVLFDQVNYKQYLYVLFMNPQILLLSNFFIKNGCHDIIHTFKNYFVTVFLVSVFNFSKNKLNPNGLFILCLFRDGKGWNTHLKRGEVWNFPHPLWYDQGDWWLKNILGITLPNEMLMLSEMPFKKLLYVTPLYFMSNFLWKN